MSPTKWILCVIAAVALAIGATACGSSGSSSSSTASSSESTQSSSESTESSSSGSSALKAAIASVEELEERPTSIGIETPLKKPPPTGKAIDYLQCGSPICVSLGETLIEAGEAVGWKVKVVDEGLTPEKDIAAWQIGVNDDPDAIIVSGGYPREVYKKQLAEAVQKGIPIVSQGDSEPKGEGVSVAVDGPTRYEKNGERLGEIVMAQSEGKAHVLIANIPVYTSDALMFEKTAAFLEQNCPECTVETFELSATSTNIAGDTAAQVQTRPEVDYVLTAFGDFAQGLPAALASISRSDVSIVTQALSPTSAEYLKKGENVTGVYGYPGVEIQWRLIDALSRVFNKESTKVDEELDYPEWLFTQKSLPNVKEPGYFPWVEEYEAQYKELWGLG
jgi:ABC-type sugar transport system substrate-binding protein